jgi:hypothetical protein
MNWGWKIVAVFGLFVTFIMYMVISMINTKVDLVSDSYYQKEIEYQQEIESLKNTNKLPTKNLLEYKAETNQLVLQLPNGMDSKTVQGEIVFFRPSQKELDQKVLLKPNSAGEQVFDLSNLKTGLWKAQLSFTHNDKPYFLEKELILP